MGAWIETTVVPLCRGVGNVAPYVGAWIETSLHILQASNYTSHPTWVRGLKPLQPVSVSLDDMSHPTWVRGLKLIC